MKGQAPLNEVITNMPYGVNEEQFGRWGRLKPSPESPIMFGGYFIIYSSRFLNEI